MDLDFDEPVDERREARLRLAVVPGALLLAWLVTATGAGRFLARIFTGMWLHELGHAMTAWLCSIPAVPGPWMTPMGRARSAAVFLLVAAGLGIWAWRGWVTERRHRAVIASGLVLLQGGCSILLPLRSAHVVITFMGDGGALVLGTLLMASFYVHAESPLRTRRLRWGFVALGAFGFADAARTWWAARTDEDAIPFGVQEYAGLSDPSRLLETYHWSVTAIVGRYLALAVVCLAALVVAQVVGVWRSRRAAAAFLAAPRRAR
jgi:hypothetical protein